MKKKLAFLILIFTIVLTLTSCDELLSKIPGLDNYLPGSGTYTVSYSGADVSPEEVKSGETATRPADPTKVGYTFIGWYDVDLAVEWNFTNPVTKDMTLYAKWEINVYDVSFDVEGYHQWVKHGDCPEIPREPEKDGWVFDGWYTDSEYTVPFDFNKPITGEASAYAKWVRKTFTVNFIRYDYDNNDAVSIYDTQTVEFGGTLTEPETPTAAFGTFEFWRDRNGVPWDFSAPVYENMELVCVFLLNRYTVTYANTSMEPYEVNHGDTIGNPVPSSGEYGYVFGGWYTDEKLTVPFDVAKPITSDTTLYAKWNKTSDSGDEELKDIKIFLVGDSTVCSFADEYLYPRYGWGTQLGGYLTDKATVVNLALSGRSSRSFIVEDEYQELINSLSEGDYLLIAFGHNDEKSDDPARFTDASKDYTDETSFGWYLYTYYIQLARSKGATPILVTPIVRAKSNDDYSGNEGHVTATGDYRQAIIDLGAATGVAVIDMTSITKDRYVELGYDEAIKYHAVLQGKYAADGTTVVENWNTVDKTHLNIYGAKYIAYRIATELAKLDGIKGYVAEGIEEPTEADRIPNSAYVVPDYTVPDLENYSAPSHFATTTDGWYGTAFGNTGGNPQSAGNGFVAKETAEGVFKVGQTAGSAKGKFENASDGFALLFTQVEADKNFIITVDATVVNVAVTSQAGFGLMLRDDCIIDQTATDSISTNYLTAGILSTSSSKMGMNFYRENTSLNKGTEVSGIWAVGDTATFTIERIGQTVNVTVKYNGNTYTKSYYDFDLFAKDGEYMYVGMFANRGTVVEFSNLEFTITGESQGA